MVFPGVSQCLGGGLDAVGFGVHPYDLAVPAARRQPKKRMDPCRHSGMVRRTRPQVRDCAPGNPIIREKNTAGDFGFDAFASPRNDGLWLYAARIFDRNASISARSTSASRRSASEEESTSAAAVPASLEALLTPTMLEDTSLVPPAACWMLRAISRVAAPCSSTAAAIAVVTSLISPMVAEMLRIADTAEVVTFCMLPICWRISSVAFAVWLARFFTSEATTAKARPASPARAASLVAWGARGIGCEAK